MTPNRIVILISPIFVGIAGWLVAWIGQHFPGHPRLDASEVTALFIAGSTFAAAKVALWIHGWQKQEGYKAGLDATTASTRAWQAANATPVKAIPVRKAQKPKPRGSAS